MNKVLIIVFSLVSFNAFSYGTTYGTSTVLTDDPYTAREVEIEIGRRNEEIRAERQRQESESINREHVMCY